MSLIGQTLGQYQIVQEIGSGGMATVYKAYQPALDRYVAVKVLAGQLAQDTTFRQRFDREAKAVAAMSHPHILPVYDFGEQEGLVYIVTELVEGGSLKERLGRPLDPGVAARIAHEVAQALDFAHRQGIVHRDVKPGNILVARDGRVRLADFGIAKMVAGTQYTQTGTTVGTPAYMSPEQGRGEEIDGRSDLYSLGVVLYEMVTGRTPFRADTPLAILHQQVFAAPPPPRELNPHLPRSLEKVILKALAKNPAERFRTGREMAQALARAVQLKQAEELPAALPEEALTVAATPPVVSTAQRLAQATGRGAAKVGKGTLRALWGLTRLLLRALIVLLIVAVVIALLATLGGAFALSSFAERTIPGYSDELRQFEGYGQPFIIREVEMNEGVSSAVAPYTLDIVRDIRFDFAPRDQVGLAAEVWGRPLHLQGRIVLEDGFLRVYVERLNNLPLYIVGGILSNGVNRGIEKLFQNASFRLELLEVKATEIVIQAVEERRSGVVPPPTPTLRPSPTAPPTEEPAGLLTIVNETNSPLILELAGRTWHLAAEETLELELPVDSYPYVFQVEAPGYQPGRGTLRVGEGNTLFRITAGGESRAVVQPTTAPAARPTQAPGCSHPGATITAPGVDAVLQGEVIVRGTADIPGFDYYKLELGAGSEPDNWSVLGDLHHISIVNGVLGVWDTRTFPKGTYVLRLVVVDRTGNYQMCQVRVRVSQ